MPEPEQYLISVQLIFQKIHGENVHAQPFQAFLLVFALRLTWERYGFCGCQGEGFGWHGVYDSHRTALATRRFPNIRVPVSTIYLCIWRNVAALKDQGF